MRLYVEISCQVLNQQCVAKDSCKCFFYKATASDHRLKQQIDCFVDDGLDAVQ